MDENLDDPMPECQEMMDKYLPKWNKIYGRFKKDTKALIKEAGEQKLNIWVGDGTTIYDFAIEFKYTIS